VSLPLISIIIPTLNSSQTFSRCLDSIAAQNYPKNKIELVVIDAFSTDDTVDIAMKYGAKVYHNRLIRAEPGKAVGAHLANGEFLLFIDSDNVLCSKNWLRKMVEPLLDNKEIIASEPLYYGYLTSENSINRYCALIGADNPVSVYLGFYGRYSHLKEKWTDLPIPSKDMGSYIEVTLNNEILPTMGANGFLIRSEILRKIGIGDSLLDVDVIYDLVKSGYTQMARVRVAVLHIYARSFTNYIQKVVKIVRYYYREIGIRKYPWIKFDQRKFLFFILSIATIFPLIKDSINGFKRIPDKAWFLNYPLCVLTLMLYGLHEFFSGFKVLRQRSAVRRTSQ